ncbi:MAG: triose-phosphate isomerase [Sphingomonadales bacterium CG12_big_fil_rev_8_21_14_0_65_65_10]|uniref:Triosephosphate isomerase n=1 Tax=Blastomonas marina TaxID=1867408 RepID=A0ABQ1FAP6_9SPHN|nr:triose-phosphate isomerase [Blastomonas marina]PIW56479.1 MAG: triose-phosphate isomerase [Sphingomonadales bacterium CG12_big_fil_rev_8_21_14_0_65_65_10]GGA03687.1 triosephosphate isomerase [Blastomonas marina]
MGHRPYIIGNWKMNGTRNSLAEARAIDRVAAKWPQVRVGIAPPHTLIHAMRDAVDSIDVGGQDCHSEETGAYTGDISASMLKDAGASFAILGHSERRQYHGETNPQVKAKSEAALAAGLNVILCVGETEEQRDAGTAEATVTRQLLACLPDVGNGDEGEPVSARLAVAYEPIWAIGTGRVPSLDDINAMHDAIRAKLCEAFGDNGAEVRILYGGSVKAENALEILGCPEVGGALVGGASLTNESFGAIIIAAADDARD